MKIITWLINRIAMIVGGISFTGIAVMMVLITVDVILRKFFNSPINGSYEIVQYLLMLVVFASFSYTQMKKGHVRVSMFVNKMPWRLRCFINGVNELLCAILSGILCYAAMVQAQYLFEGKWTSDVLRFPTSPFFWFESVASFVFALVLLWDAVRNFKAMFNKEEADELSKDYI